MYHLHQNMYYHISRDVVSPSKHFTRNRLHLHNKKKENNQHNLKLIRSLLCLESNKHTLFQPNRYIFRSL